MDLVKIRKNLYLNGWFNGPFGKRWIINADSTASGSCYKEIEEYMETNIKPFYSNTHSNALTGKFMSECIEDTKKIIRQTYNCNEDDMIIFTGNGCTGAILHLIHALNIEKKGKNKSCNKKQYVVFNSVLEHHSNYLPWKNLNVYLELIPIDKNGRISQNIFNERLQYWNKNAPNIQIIVSFVGGSNVSGIIEDWHNISKLTHTYNGLIFWDMAACAPYTHINMHYNDDNGEYMDAIFVSPHKFLGGPGTPGLLISNKKLFKNKIPYCPGGGTVRFVCPNYEIYTPDIETKETGGTPNILGCIKLGKVFELKNDLQHYVEYKEHKLYQYIYPKLLELEKNNIIKLIVKPNINTNIIPIFSFIVINSNNNSLYHYNLIVVLLNDLFGIQSRGGVSCCSVFAQYILQLDEKEQKDIYNSISQGNGVPNNYGWCRVSFHYTMTKEIVDYILYAIEFVAKYINKLQLYYEYDKVKNSWNYNYNGKWNDLKPSQKLFIEDPPNNIFEYCQNIISWIFNIKMN
jgi:selenocysteine lyase/cysteine desulfurase